MSDQGLRVLMISLERGLFTQGNRSRQRIIDQAKDFAALTILVPAKQKFDAKIAENVRVVSTASLARVFYIIDAWRKLKQLKREGLSFDVVTSQDPFETGLIAYWAAKIFGAALAIQDHGHHYHGDYYRQEAVINRFRYRLGLWLLPKADAIRAVSRRGRDYLLKLGLRPQKVIQFPLALDDFETVGSDEASRIPHDKKLFIIVARFVPFKRIDIAIRAFAALRKQRSDVRLAILGKGPLEHELRRLITQSGLEQDVQIVPWTSDVKAWYRAATATLITSDREGFGMTAVESLVCGTPVIMTDVGCAGEVVQDRINGYIVPPGDVTALADRMERIIQDPDGLRAQARTFVWSPPNITLKSFLEKAVELKRQKIVTSGRRLLIYTPTVDKNHPIFGFMVRWLNEFRQQTDGLIVVSRYVNREELADDIVTYEVGKPWLSRTCKINRIAFKERANYGTVFVHMTPHAAIAGFIVWKLLKKPVYLWYAHGAVPLNLRLAEKTVRKIFASSPTGLTLKTPKACFVGQGIDVGLFKPSEQPRRPEIIAVSRIHPSKKYEQTLEFLAEYRKKYPDDVWIYIILGTSEDYETYVQSLKDLAAKLGLQDRFQVQGPKIYTELPAVYASAAAFISTSQTGSLDKVVLEALACGTPVLASGRGYQGLAGVTDLMQKENAMVKLHEALIEPKTDWQARQGIIDDHSLPRLVKVLLTEMSV